MEGVDEDKGSMDQEVGKIIWSQMAILQALVMYLAVHREEGVEHKDEDKHQLEPRHVDKIPWTQILILTIIATSTMWTGCTMTVFNLYRPFMSP